jgi:hypothetical protein
MCDVWMIERRRGRCFLFEIGAAISIGKIFCAIFRWSRESSAR